MNGHWIKSQRAVSFPLEGLDPLRYTVLNGNGRGSSPTPPDLVATSGSCSTSAEPMEVGPASRGGSPGDSNQDDSSGRKSAHRLEEDVGSQASGTGDTVDGEVVTNEGMDDAREEGKKLKRKRSNHIMEVEEEEDLSAGTAGSDTAEATLAPTQQEDKEAKLYNLCAISVSV